jgi:hypothetical protein
MSKILLLAVLGAGLVSAQNPNQLQSTFIRIPRASQRAVLTQRIALTDVTITYSRPVALDRKVFGGIVPYGQVWRAGANENTTIEFGTDVKIDGQPLAQGVYGLHMIPGENEWVVAFSKNSTSWGSFTYDEKEDALRVKVKPVAADMRDVLIYDFESLKPESSTLTLRWERVAVPVNISVDRIATTLDSLHKQLRFTAQFTWEGLNDAAEWCIENKVNYDEALKWVDMSIGGEERFENLDTKSQLLKLMGKEEESKQLHARALEKANAIQHFVYARGLQRAGKTQEAFALYRENAKKNPDSWIIHLGLARILSADQNFDGAAKEMRLAIAGTANNKPQVQALEGLLKRLENKEDINR